MQWILKLDLSGRTGDAFCLPSSLANGSRSAALAKFEIALHRLHFRQLSHNSPDSFAILRHPRYAGSPPRRTDAVVALLHLSLYFIPVESETSDGEPISRSGTCAFSVPLIHFPPSTNPEFIAFLIPPDAVAAAAAAADQHRLDCVYGINTSLHAPPIFICSTFHHTAYPTLAKQQAIAGSSLAAAASQIFGLSLEAPADAALHLLDQGDGVFDRLSSLDLKLWLINEQYPPAVQNMLLLIAATHYLVRATAVTENALVNCSVAPSLAHTNVPPTCMQLLYIHKRFVFPIPSRYNDNMVIRSEKLFR